MAKIVYLDTSDFSYLADVGEFKKSLEAQECLSKAIDISNSGRIQFVFSYVHICEVLKAISGASEVARRKMDIIQKLCKGVCFVDPYRVWEMEIEAYKNGGKLSREDILTRGRWYPPIKVEFGEYKREMNAALVDAVRRAHEGKPRKERRALEAKLRNPASLEALSLVARQHILDKEVQLTEALAREYPLSKEFIQKRFLGKLLRGEISDDEYMNEVLADILRPDSLVEVVLDKRPELQVLYSDFDQIALELERKIRAGQNDASAITSGLPKQVIKKVLKSAANNAKVRMKHLHEHAAENITADFLDDPKRNAETPSIHVLTTLVRALVGTYVAVGPNTAKPERGDYGDLLHITYAPYCYVFRTDKRVVERLRQQSPSVPVNLCSTTTTTPKFIDSLVATA